MIEKKPLVSLHTIKGRRLDLPRYQKQVDPSTMAEKWTQRLAQLTDFHHELRLNSGWQEHVSAFVDRHEELSGNPDPRSVIWAQLGAYLSDTDMRRAFLRNIDDITDREGAALLEKARGRGNRIDDVDVVLVGGNGLHGSVAATELQSYDPTPSFVSLDASKRGGKTFRIFPEGAPHETAVFTINSLPAESFSSIQSHRSAAAHLRTVRGDDHSRPSQDIFAGVIAANSYLAGESIQGATVEKVVEHGNSTVSTFVHNREIFKLVASRAVVARGLEEQYMPIRMSPETDKLISQSKVALEGFVKGETDTLPSIITGRDFLAMVVARRGKVFNALTEKKVVLVGGEDTAQSILKLFIGHGNPEVYEEYNSERRKHEISWMVPDATKENIWLRPQHEVIRSHINDTIHPFVGRAMDVSMQEGAVKLIYKDDERQKSLDTDLIIYATGYKKDEKLELPPHLEYLMDGETGEVIGKGSERVYLVGPTADIPLTQEEVDLRPDFASRHGTNNAANRLVPKTQRLIYHLVSALELEGNA